MTPRPLAAQLVSDLDLSADSRVLEPSFGDGSFLVPLIERLVELGSGSERRRFERVMIENLWGVELDPGLRAAAVAEIEDRWGEMPDGHHLESGDFFRFSPESLSRFDVIVGNPPFGGSFDRDLEDALDRRYGVYRGHKLKKETYSFFVAKCLELLSPEGRLRFICSDTFLTIKTMRGLRELLLDSGRVSVSELPEAFADTAQPMVVLDLERGKPSSSARIRGAELTRRAMESTQNLSWGLRPEHVELFDGPALSDFIVATGGMTIGRNEWFVRSLEADGSILEPYEFEFFDRPLTLELALAQARLNRLSRKQQDRVLEQERAGETRRAVRVRKRESPERVHLPHPDYRWYNKASGERLYAPPEHVVYWRDEGDAVLTFKRDGNWYLRGVGGKPFFGREGLTWQLVAAKLKCRYLPPGYILDSGAPCAFLLDGVPSRELYLILGWLLTDLATEILKSAINHTRNIQGKDVERLPYPHWVGESSRVEIAQRVESQVTRAMNGRQVEPAFYSYLNERFGLAGPGRVAA
jgi:hypothetical protein